MSGRPLHAAEPLAEALAHLTGGFALLPVGPDKAPASALIRATRGTPGWRQLRSRPAREPEVRAWFELDPEVGIAVIAGEPSGGLVVVDVDRPELVPELPTSATVATVRGVHLYLHADRPTRTRRFPWGELRGERTYVVAPYSRHPSGGRYTWALTPEEAGFAELESCELAPPSPPSALLVTPLLVTGPLGLAELERDEALALRLAHALGVPVGVELGEAFRCVLSEERNPSATLWRRSSEERVLYHDWHSCSGEEWLPLAVVRARLAGCEGRLGGPELAVWKLRLAAEAGIVEPVELEGPAHDGSEKPLWGGFLHLLALRWTIEPGVPAPFSARFAAAWCGVTKREAHEGIRELVCEGRLRLAGVDAHGTRLWLPEGVRPLD